MGNKFRVFLRDSNDPILVEAGRFEIVPSLPFVIPGGKTSPITFYEKNELESTIIDIATIPMNERITKDNIVAVAIEDNTDIKTFRISLENGTNFLVQGQGANRLPEIGVGDLVFFNGSINFDPKDGVQGNIVWVAPGALQNVEEITNEPFLGNAEESLGKHEGDCN